MIFTSLYPKIEEEHLLYFKFWANCIPVKGYRKTLIYDVFRRRFLCLSNSFYELFLNYKIKDLKSLQKESNFKYKIEYFKYLQYFVNNDLGIYTTEPDAFPKMSLRFEIPYKISTAIIEYNSDTPKYNFNKVIEGLTLLNLRAIQINDFGKMELSQMKDISKITEKSSIEYIEIFSQCSKLQSGRLFNHLLENFRIRKIVYLDSTIQKCIKYKDTRKGYVHYSLNKNEICGNINMASFAINLPFFTESQAHNTCPNRKLCIDAEGNIKNCPAMERSFGNIKDTTLQEAIEKEGFKDLWFINKDKIDVCKDCEFRYMCMDCRCFIKDPENIYSQPAKCGYNPYICKWAGQEGYVPVKECGTYKRETGFVPDTAKIRELNQQIWGED